MKCVILQPSYIPWRGYFDQIRRADIFVFYDDVQFDKGGWRHRNRICTPVGPQWLTIPVKHKGHLRKSLQVKDVRIDWNQNWIVKHWRSIFQNYARSPFFNDVATMLQPFYESRPETLCDMTIPLTIRIAEFMGFPTRFLRSSEMNIDGGQTERLINIVKATSCSHYISGPSARSYLDEAQFDKAGISLQYAVYNYPEYRQLCVPFDPQVSIVDSLFMLGPSAEACFGSS